MNLHIHLVQQEAQAGGEELPNLRNNPGCHALFAFEILRRPFSEFRGRAWNLFMGGPLYEAWDRQIHWIESLHLPGANPTRNPVFELRFVTWPDEPQIGIYFLGKTFAPTADEARSEALALSQEVFSLFPFDFVVRPLSDPSDFERAYRLEWTTKLECPEQIVEIRRFGRMVPNLRNRNGMHFLYLTHGWEWHLQSMDQVWCALAKYQRPLMFCISLSPVVWDTADYVYLNELESTVNEKGLPSALASEVDSALKLYRQLLYQTPRPFTMRTTLVGTPNVPRGLANAVGVGLCVPPLQGGNHDSVLSADYAVAIPRTSTDFSIAKLNLTQLNQYHWGNDLVGHLMRLLLYAFNAKQAQAAFRLPIPPEAGFPGLLLGKEVESILGSLV
jgi:hypothetical protein